MEISLGSLNPRIRHEVRIINMWIEDFRLFSEFEITDPPELRWRTFTTMSTINEVPEGRT